MKIGDSQVHEGKTYWLVPEDIGCNGCAFLGKNGACDRPREFDTCLATVTDAIFTTDEVLGLTYRLIRS